MKKSIFKLTVVSLLAVATNLFCLADDDWAQFNKYSAQNDSIKALGLSAAPEVVFMGNSITEGWMLLHPGFFTDNNFLCRGISGQTTEQMLLRFREDVINLHPETVVINGGTNDIAENSHAYNEERTFGNLVSMAELASAHGINVVMTSVLPVEKYFWSPLITDAPEKIAALNRLIRAYADEKGYPYVDYYSVMHEDNRRLAPAFTEDGVHPTHKGYDVMESILSPVLNSLHVKSAPVTVALWYDKAPAFSNGIPVSSEMEESSDWITQVASPELYIYPAADPNGKALLMCPGGGYYGVAIAHEGKDMAKELNKNGITLAVLKYRMPNGHARVPEEDVMEALRILNAHASEWGIDKSKIGIGGASAGGHLASTVATGCSDVNLKPAFQVLLYPVISMKEGLTHQGSRNLLLGESPSRESVEHYSNELHVNAATPPAFIAVSGDDDVVPVENSILYYEALRANGVPASLHIYPNGGHGWGVRPEFAFSTRWMDEMISWLSDL